MWVVGGKFLSTSVQKLAILVDPISTLQSRYCWYLKGHLQPQHITQNTQQPRTKMSRVGILPDGHIRMNPIPRIPTKHSVPTSRERLPGYFGIPMVIPTLRSLIGPALNKVQTIFPLNKTTLATFDSCYIPRLVPGGTAGYPAHPRLIRPSVHP